MSNEVAEIALIEQLYFTGLIQFGNFAQPGGARSPLSLRFDLFASYPAILGAVADGLAPLLSPNASRLLCAWDAVALGTALALKTGVPLVYSRGMRDAPVHDLAGAYDIGHQTILLLPEASQYTAASTSELIVRARSVGLDVVGVLSLIQHHDASREALPLTALLHVERLGRMMHQAGYITPLQVEMLKNLSRRL